MTYRKEEHISPPLSYKCLTPHKGDKHHGVISNYIISKYITQFLVFCDRVFGVRY